MKAIHAAEEYTRQARHVETLKLFDINVQGSPVNVTWLNGSSLGGYKELREAIGEIVSEGFEALKAEAIRRAEEKLAKAEAELRAALGEKA
jgi:hypothetical protein